MTPEPTPKPEPLPQGVRTIQDILAEILNEEALKTALAE